MKVYGTLDSAALEQLAANPTAYRGRMYFNTITLEVRVYTGVSWVVVGSGGGGGGGSAWIVTGTFIAPTSIVAANGITPVGSPLELIYVAGAGVVDISKNPQIAAGANAGDVLELVGTSNVNTVLLEDGTGLALNGACLLNSGQIIGLRWDNTSLLWRERYRS